MDVVYQNLLANAFVAMVLAILVAAITRVVRHPPLAHFLWLLVLLKLVTPALWRFEISIPGAVSVGSDSVRTQMPVSQITLGGTAGQEQAGKNLSINFDGPSSDRKESGVLPEVPATLPPPASLPPAEDGATATNPKREQGMESATSPPDRLATGRDQRHDLLESGAGSLAPEASLPQLAKEKAVMRADLAASKAWSWQSPLRVAGWVWLAGSILWFTVAALRVIRFERCRRLAEPAPADLQAEARRLARQLGLARCPAICVVEGRLPPLLWAMTGKATILLPARLMEQIPPSQQAMVVAHEMAHFARRDHWLRWLEVLVLGIYWWFPVAWWARRQLHQVAEQCCDAWVVWLFPNGARCYARSLLETIDFLTAAQVRLPLGASSLGQFHFHSLQRRFRMILSKSMDRKMPRSMRIAAVFVGLAILSFSARGVRGEGDSVKQSESKPDYPQTAQTKADAPAPKTAENDADKPTPKTEETKPDARSVPAVNKRHRAVNALVVPPGGIPAAGQTSLLPPQDSPSAGLPPLAPPTARFPGANPLNYFAAPGVQPEAPSVVPIMPGALTTVGQPPANVYYPSQPNGGIAPVPLLPPQQANIEQRLQRLEAVTNQILQELKSQHSQNPGANPYHRGQPPIGDTNMALESMNAAQLNAVDQEIKALAAEMRAMEAKMALLQDARAKLASRKHDRLEKDSESVPESDPRMSPGILPPPIRP